MAPPLTGGAATASHTTHTLITATAAAALVGGAFAMYPREQLLPVPGRRRRSRRVHVLK